MTSKTRQEAPAAESGGASAWRQAAAAGAAVAGAGAVGAWFWRTKQRGMHSADKPAKAPGATAAASASPRLSSRSASFSSRCWSWLHAGAGGGDDRPPPPPMSLRPLKQPPPSTALSEPCGAATPARADLIAQRYAANTSGSAGTTLSLSGSWLHALSPAPGALRHTALGICSGWDGVLAATAMGSGSDAFGSLGSGGMLDAADFSWCSPTALPPAAPAAAPAAAAEAESTVQLCELQLCYKPNGVPWLLGRGGFGQVRRSLSQLLGLHQTGSRCSRLPTHAIQLLARLLVCRHCSTSTLLELIVLSLAKNKQTIQNEMCAPAGVQSGVQIGGSRSQGFCPHRPNQGPGLPVPHSDRLTTGSPFIMTACR